MGKTVPNWKETEQVGITPAGKNALKKAQVTLKLIGDWRVEPNERDAYNRIRSWKVLDRDGKRFVTTKTKADALKLTHFLTEKGL